MNPQQRPAGTPPPDRPRPLAADITALEGLIADLDALSDLPQRWLALKLLETDEPALQRVDERLGAEEAAAIREATERHRQTFEREHGLNVNDHVIACRSRTVTALLDGIQNRPDGQRRTLSERIDQVVLNRWAAPALLVATVFLIYQVSIVLGYELTNYTWPILADVRELAARLLPEAGFLFDPYVRALGLWLVDSTNTLLNYVPIFLILFASIAIIEDSGYMARIAFILDAHRRRAVERPTGPDAGASGGVLNAWTKRKLYQGQRPARAPDGDDISSLCERILSTETAAQVAGS